MYIDIGRRCGKQQYGCGDKNMTKLNKYIPDSYSEIALGAFLFVVSMYMFYKGYTDLNKHTGKRGIRIIEHGMRGFQHIFRG